MSPSLHGCGGPLNLTPIDTDREAEGARRTTIEEVDGALGVEVDDVLVRYGRGASVCQLLPWGVTRGRAHPP